MVLATSDASGAPSARYVLLKEVDEHGFVFFTNRSSRKGFELTANPRAALCFYWPHVGEQVRIEGDVVPIADTESDAYFATRPRETQLGAWASKQSQPLSSREELSRRLAELHERFGQEPVPRPPFWGGYRVVPRRIEFWKQGMHRLHERTVYERTPKGWRTQTLFP